MTNLRYGKKNEEWVKNHPHLANAIANLRGQAGMSERAIVETMRGYTRENHKGMKFPWGEKEVGTKFEGLVNSKDAPSYGDVRAAFETFRASHLKLHGKSEQRLDFKSGLYEEGHSKYRHNIPAQFSANQIERLNRKTVAGYLIHAETPSEEWADPEAYVKWEESQEYDRTPPF